MLSPLKKKYISRVKYGAHGPSRCSQKGNLLGSFLLCWFVAAKPSTDCKYCLYSLSIFTVYLCD